MTEKEVKPSIFFTLERQFLAALDIAAREESRTRSSLISHIVQVWLRERAKRGDDNEHN